MGMRMMLTSFSPPTEVQLCRGVGLIRISRSLIQDAVGVFANGKRFNLLFKPLRFQITSTKELEKLFRFYCQCEKLKWGTCHTAALNTDLEKCANMLELVLTHCVRPERQHTNNFFFQSMKKIAPFEIHRFLSNGSVQIWVKQLASRAGQTTKNNAYGYLAGRIISPGLVLREISPKQPNSFNNRGPQSWRQLSPPGCGLRTRPKMCQILSLKYPLRGQVWIDYV